MKKKGERNLFQVRDHCYDCQLNVGTRTDQPILMSSACVSLCVVVTLGCRLLWASVEG